MSHTLVSEVAESNRIARVWAEFVVELVEVVKETSPNTSKDELKQLVKIRLDVDLEDLSMF